jgi:formylglycine-generating enzyme required for sulfatase activity
MAARRLRVFVSSTYLDNKLRRQLVERAIRSAGMEPVGMERFEASVHAPVDVCLEKLGDCDLLVGILAWRYGWVPPGCDKSITEIEYDAAKQRLMFLARPKETVTRAEMDEGTDRGAKQDKLDQFKARIAETPSFFTDEELQLLVVEALQNWKRQRSSKARKARRSEARPIDATLERLARSFVTRVASAFDGLVLMGFETKFRTPLRLEDLFVPLHVRWSRGDEGWTSLRSDEVAERNPSIPEALGSLAPLGKRGLVILGYPGSGKTTQLKRILLWLAQRKPEDLELPAGMLPLFLRLRLATGKERTLLELAKTTAARGDDEQAPLSLADAELLERVHERGNLLWLCDGLDEVADERIRANVAGLIATAAEQRKADRFVVSCRFAGYSDDVEKQLGARFRVLELAPLDDAQVATLVRNWYCAVECSVGRSSGRSDAESERVAKMKAEELLERLNDGKFRSSTRLAELTQNPLLLTAICLVHRDRGEHGGLPKRRADLYEECINVLLELWRKTHNVPVSISAKDARRVLQPLALWMHSENGRRQATASELEPVVAPLLKKIRWKGGNATRFLEIIRDESGLLTGQSTTAFGFVHLGFQEHLAARELRTQLVAAPERLADLASRLHESWWQEVTLLLLAQEDAPIYAKYLSAALAHPQAGEHIEFLTQCRDEADSTTDEPIESVLQGLARARRASAAQLVALDLAVRWDVSIPASLREHADHRVRQVLGIPSESMVVEFGGVSMGFSFGVGAFVAQPPRALSARGEIELVAIPAGTFWMGCAKERIARLKREHPQWTESFDREAPRHEVTLSPFFMAATPVTNAQYARFLKSTPKTEKPKYWADRRFNQPDQPVVGVSWEDAVRFCEWAGVRLPTEAQWEYACRAGTDTNYWSGDTENDLWRVGWFDYNSNGGPQRVARKLANPWGLYDMHGNVWEWCADWFGDYANGRQVDPAGPAGGSVRVVRGGSFGDGAAGCRSACRDGLRPSNCGSLLSFRVALPAAPSSR